MLFGGESGFERFGRAAMSSAGMVENDGQFAQEFPCFARDN